MDSAYLLCSWHLCSGQVNGFLVGKSALVGYTEINKEAGIVSAIPA